MAVLGSGALTPGDAAALLDALAASPLYRADQHSYILYPDRRLPALPREEQHPGLGRRRVAAAHGDAAPRRPADRREGRDRRRALQRGLPQRVAPARGAGGAPRTASWARSPRRRRRGSWRSTRSSSTTSPSRVAPAPSTSTRGWAASTGTWSRSCCSRCRRCRPRAAGAAEPAVLRRLQEHYDAIREGIGVHKPPTEYGAIPDRPLLAHARLRGRPAAGDDRAR